MNVRRLVIALVWAVLISGVALLGPGLTREIPLEWTVAAIAGLLAWTMLSEIVAVVPFPPDELRPAWRPAGRRKRAPDLRPRELVLLEGLLQGAATSERAVALRLRPRLSALADHMLRTRHGIEMAREPERVASVLGDVAWLVDHDPESRANPAERWQPGSLGTADVADIDRLLDRLLAESDDTDHSPDRDAC